MHESLPLPQIAGPRGRTHLKILLLVRALGFGGTERQVVYIAQGLARRSHQVNVVAFYQAKAFEAAFSNANPTCAVIGKRARWDVVGFIWRLIHAIAMQQPDVIYSMLPVPNLLAGLLRVFFRPRIALVWGLRGTQLDLACCDRLERTSIRLERLASRLPDLVIANSCAGAAWARAVRFPAKRLQVIRNGIDTDKFRPATRNERDRARAALGCAEDAFIVAIVGRIAPMKDHRSFLQALTIVARAAPHMIGLIVGDGPKPIVDRLRAQAEALGIAERVIWIRARPEVTEVYHAADTLCLSSAYGEGFPNVVGEAMACGLSCIVTAVGDAAAVVDNTGRVVPPRDATELARAILDCIKPPRAGGLRCMAARRRIVDHFGLEAMITATERALLSAVARRN